MDNYRKGSNTEEEMTRNNIPIENLPEDFLWMHVKGGTKISNVIDYAKKALDSNEHRHIVWSSSGGGVGKTVSAVEIMKRHYKPLYQVTRIAYQKVEENWVPLVEGLEDIVVKRQIPAIHILTSLDPIDPNTIGYQVSTEPRPFPNRIDTNNDEPFDLHDRRNPRPKTKPQQLNNDQDKDSKKHLPKKKKRNKPREGTSSQQQPQKPPSKNSNQVQDQDMS